MDTWQTFFEENKTMSIKAFSEYMIQCYYGEAYRINFWHIPHYSKQDADFKLSILNLMECIISAIELKEITPIGNHANFDDFRATKASILRNINNFDGVEVDILYKKITSYRYASIQAADVVKWIYLFSEDRVLFLPPMLMQFCESVSHIMKQRKIFIKIENCHYAIKGTAQEQIDVLKAHGYTHPAILAKIVCKVGDRTGFGLVDVGNVLFSHLKIEDRDLRDKVQRLLKQADKEFSISIE